MCLLSIGFQADSEFYSLNKSMVQYFSYMPWIFNYGPIFSSYMFRLSLYFGRNLNLRPFFGPRYLGSVLLLVKQNMSFWNIS